MGSGAIWPSASSEGGIRIARGGDLVGDPEYAFATAGWYWGTKNLNEPADDSNIREITRTINSGSNGAAKRKENYDRAREILDGQ